MFEITLLSAVFCTGTPPNADRAANHFVCDLGSSCGSFLATDGGNPVQLQAYQYRALTNGCTLTFGESARKYVVRGADANLYAAPKSNNPFAPSEDNVLAGGGRAAAKSPKKRMQIQAGKDFEDNQDRGPLKKHPPTPNGRKGLGVIEVEMGNGGRRGGRGGGRGGGAGGRGREKSAHEKYGGRNDNNNNARGNERGRQGDRAGGNAGARDERRSNSADANDRDRDLTLYPGDIVVVKKLKEMAANGFDTGAGGSVVSDNSIAEVLYAGTVYVDGKGRCPLLGLRFPFSLPLTAPLPGLGGLPIHPCDGALPRELSSERKRYFRCKPGHGLYVSPAEAQLQPADFVPAQVKSALKRQGIGNGGNVKPKSHERVLLPPVSKYMTFNFSFNSNFD